MAKLILRSNYFKNEPAAHRSNYIKYLGTREGVEMNPETLPRFFYEDQDMHGKKDRADKREHVALVDRADAGAGNTEKIQSRTADPRAEPRKQRHLFFQEQTEYGHKQHIKRRDESDFSGGGVIERPLLKIACYAQGKPENNAVFI